MLGETPRPSFDVLDDVVRQREARGVLGVRLGGLDELVAVAAHVERRARAQQRDVVRAAAPLENPWSDVATRLGIEPLPHDPGAAANAIVSRSSARGAVVVVPFVQSNAWDHAVAEAVCEAAPNALFVLLALPGSGLEVRAASWFDLATPLTAAGAARWWDAAATALRARPAPGLGALEQWLGAATELEPSAPAAGDLPAPARELLHKLALSRRAWPERSLGLLGSELALSPLVAKGLVDQRDRRVAAACFADALEPTQAELEQVAEALIATFPVVCWALARAAELFAAAGALTRAEPSMQKALELAADSAVRVGLWSRWRTVAESRGPSESGPISVRAAELALGLGDVEMAVEWAERAGLSEPGPRAAHALGRAVLARGDLVLADAALSRAHSLADDPTLLAEITVDRAEACYAAGDLVSAERLAQEVDPALVPARVALAARNLLGKLLLARAEWDAAEAHFALDACEAKIKNEPLAELRARVNRAIALLSRGSSDEALAMLREVLERAEAQGETRAVGFALSNLAVLAIERHDYAQALELSERAIAARRRLGDRLGYARDVTNLVELRLRLGLVEQAEQGLRFGRQALGAGAPASRLCELALAAARIHLARGRTLDAERELRAALRTAAQASDGDKLGECHRLAARIALEDGVVARAEGELARAVELGATPFARAELALLTALIARAKGQAVRELGLQAAVFARESGDEELLREAHVLLAEVSLADGDVAALGEHVRVAVILRDEVARLLPGGTRDAYLARRDLIGLTRLERLVAERFEDERLEDEALLPSLAPAGSPPPRRRQESLFVGRHPNVVALLESVERIGRTQTTLLVCGESGTGKELIADAIHAASDRAKGPLIKVNCAALVESLLLSELFGHEKGAFTGALSRRRGRFERASSGTLFLDEIGDISPRTQVALLRVLEERKIERVGGSTAIPVDVRIVCATHRDLRALVERGEFREDLYYRLSGITLHVPPLRERISDVPLLSQALLGRIAAERSETERTIADGALALLMRHHWPGNVRELENVLRAVSLFAEGATIEEKDLIEHVEVLRRLNAEPHRHAVQRAADELPSAFPANGAESEPGASDAGLDGVVYREIRESQVSLSSLKRRIERECIARALREAEGNITRAAALLGMKRPRLSQLVKQYRLSSLPPPPEHKP